MMRRVAFAIVLLALPAALYAQTPDPGSLSDTQKLGQRLFYQSCGVCHLKPQITSGQYAPVLSKDTLGGDADALREFISQGTPRMPGFRFQFEPGQLNAIVAYLKTVPVPAAPAAGAR
jgi:mono/diheme cytochrome c family protein